MAISLLEFNYIRNLMASQTGVVIPENQKFLAESRLLTLVKERQMSSVSELIEQAKSDSNGLTASVIDVLLPKDTAFFRDNHPFTLLRKTILPLLEMRLFNRRKLTIWCAGCSTGQEPYSIAMLIHTYFPQLLEWELGIYGTDLSEDALSKAKEAKYNEIEINRGVPPLLAKQCFRQEGPAFLMREEIRDIVQFEPLNLIGDWPQLQEVDVVLLRNVLSYLSMQSRRAVLEKLKQILKPTSYIILGARETTENLDPSYRQVPTENTVYYQVS